MSWSLQGTYFENCSCDMVCPCTTSGLTMPADQERCGVMLAFHVSKGEIEDTDVSDKTVIIVADTPPIMAEGNWRVGVIMDASATEEQAQKLGAVFGGQAGGPMAALAPLITETLGMETAQIEYVDDGRPSPYGFVQDRAQSTIDLVTLVVDVVKIKLESSGHRLADAMTIGRRAG